MHQCTEQPWFRGARSTHPALRAMHLERSNRGRGSWRTKDRGLEHIPGPMIAEGQPQRIAETALLPTHQCAGYRADLFGVISGITQSYPAAAGGKT